MVTTQFAGLQDCISACQRCHQICFEMATTHCLQMGGKHVEAQHLKLMINCAEICQTAANFMLSRSPLHGVVCQVCEKVCQACAESCKAVGDMDECVAACQDCAHHCHKMANTQ